MTSHWIRRGAVALAAARAGLGVAALVSPALIARPWVGGEAGAAGGEAGAAGGEAGAAGGGAGAAGGARGPAARVLGRALGGRDLALGLGALAALQGGRLAAAGAAAGAAPGAGAARGAGIWIGAGALSDSLDVLATATAWDELPAVGRWLVALSAGGAAVSGAIAAWLLITGEADGGS
jgi:hypothetical protein